MIRVRQNGFSLPEVLVALLIFSTIAAVSVVVLRQSINARDQLGMVNDNIDALELSRALIKDDMAQIVLREVRDEFGAKAGPAFRDGYTGTVFGSQSNEQKLLAFVRGGWSNPDWAAPRSTLQYVEYIYAKGALIRRARPFLDSARNAKVYERSLMPDVEDIEVAFLQGEVGGRLEWVQSWPSRSTNGSAPRAIAISMRNKHFGEMRQLFWIGTLTVNQDDGSG